jgi:hypothetical protein
MVEPTPLALGLLILAALAGAALLVTAAVALPRQIDGIDPAARECWWPDYTVRATVLAVAGVLAACRGPGWRILRGLRDAIWLYLGLVAALVLAAPPRILGSCRRSRGSPPVGIGFGVAAWRGPDREEAGTPRRAQPYRNAGTWSNSRCDSPIGPEALIITNSASGIRPRTSVPRSWAPGASMIRCGREYPRSAVDYYHAVIFIRGLTRLMPVSGRYVTAGFAARALAMIVH